MRPKLQDTGAGLAVPGRAGAFPIGLLGSVDAGETVGEVEADDVMGARWDCDSVADRGIVPGESAGFVSLIIPFSRSRMRSKFSALFGLEAVAVVEVGLIALAFKVKK